MWRWHGMLLGSSCCCCIWLHGSRAPCTNLARHRAAPERSGVGGRECRVSALTTAIQKEAFRVARSRRSKHANGSYGQCGRQCVRPTSRQAETHHHHSIVSRDVCLRLRRYAVGIGHYPRHISVKRKLCRCGWHQYEEEREEIAHCSLSC